MVVLRGKVAAVAVRLNPEVFYSIVIPVLNEREHIVSLLQKLRELHPDSELIVVDGGSDDETVAAAMPLCDQLLLGERGRAAQMNLGGRVASGEYIFFLHADTLPCVTSADLRCYLVRRPQWGFFRVQLTGKNPVFRVIEWAMNLRSITTRVATGDQAIFLRRDVFLQTDGFASQPLMEDVEYCKRLRRGAKPQVIAEPVLTSSRRWEEAGVIKTVLKMWALRLAYCLGVRPERLWQYYYGR